MSNLQKSKPFDLIDKFNDTSWYLDDILTIDNHEFAEHSPDIYPRELQMNKANTLDKETSFLDFNIKVIGSNIHTRVYDKRVDFGFPIIEELGRFVIETCLTYNNGRCSLRILSEISIFVSTLYYLKTWHLLFDCDNFYRKNWLKVRGVGSILRLRGHQKCKPQIESRSRNLITSESTNLKIY